MRARLLIAALALLAAPLALASAAAADPYPPSGVHVVPGQVSPASVASGGAVIFSGGGFAPASPLRLSVDGAPRGTVASDAAGSFSVTLTLSGSGDQVLAASGLEPSGRVRVVSATAAVGGDGASGLPTTGSDRMVPALGMGLGSVVVGSLLVLVARARRRRLAAS